jgi:hypothetical protein
MTDPLSAVRRAARAEKAAEQNREQGERDWRQTWWATTDALAAVPATPREQLGDAIRIVVQVTGNSRDWVSKRRSCGRWFVALKRDERATLQPRFAVASLEAKADAETAAELIRQAEHEGASLREFNTMLTGRSWTNTPENLTQTERVDIARKELRTRPEVVLDDETSEVVDEMFTTRRAREQHYTTSPEHVEYVVGGAKNQMAKTLGTELPLMRLREAISEIVGAIHEKSLFGLHDVGTWNELLDQIHRVEEMARAEVTVATITDDDRRMLEELGLGDAL